MLARDCDARDGLDEANALPPLWDPDTLVGAFEPVAPVLPETRDADCLEADARDAEAREPLTRDADARDADGRDDPPPRLEAS